MYSVRLKLLQRVITFTCFNAFDAILFMPLNFQKGMLSFVDCTKDNHQLKSVHTVLSVIGLAVLKFGGRPLSRRDSYPNFK